MNRLTTITYPDSSSMQFAYDYRGRRISVTDQNSETTNYAYDDADRLTSVKDAARNITQYAYDTENNLTGRVARTPNGGKLWVPRPRSLRAGLGFLFLLPLYEVRI